MSRTFTPALLLISFLILFIHLTPTTGSPTSLSNTNTPNTHKPTSLLFSNEEDDELTVHISEDSDDDLDTPTVFRRIFATARVLNIIRRYRRFAPLALNADPDRSAQIRAALLTCLRSLRALQRMNNSRNIRTLLAGLVALLDWLACLLN